MDTVARFDFSKEKFQSDHANMPWSEMRGMRNLFAHEYESVDKDLLWETITKDIPGLHDQLQEIYDSE